MSMLRVCWRAWHVSIKCLGVSSSFSQSLHLASGLIKESMVADPKSDSVSL